MRENELISVLSWIVPLDFSAAESQQNTYQSVLINHLCFKNKHTFKSRTPWLKFRTSGPAFSTRSLVKSPGSPSITSTFALIDGDISFHFFFFFHPIYNCLFFFAEKADLNNKQYCRESGCVHMCVLWGTEITFDDTNMLGSSTLIEQQRTTGLEKDFLLHDKAQELSPRTINVCFTVSARNHTVSCCYPAERRGTASSSSSSCCLTVSARMAVILTP